MSLPWSSAGPAAVLPALAILVAMSVILVFAIAVSMTTPLCGPRHLSMQNPSTLYVGAIIAIVVLCTLGALCGFKPIGVVRKHFLALYWTKSALFP